MKKSVIALAVSLILAASLNVQGAGLSSWFSDRTADNASQQTEPAEQTSGTSAAQMELPLADQAIVSLGFGGKTVGRTVIPQGWTLETVDLSVNPESMTCPNAVWVTATSPDGKAKLTYLSRREFSEAETYYGEGYGLGYSWHSEDDIFDFGELMHYLDYREAPQVCDLMVNILYSGNPVLVGETDITTGNEEVLSSLRKSYDRSVSALVNQTNQFYGDNIEVRWTDVTTGMRTYLDGDKKMTLFSLTEGFEAYKDIGIQGFYDGYQDTIFWCMDATFCLWTDADVHDSYMGIFDTFINCTSVSQEYEQMRHMNADELQQMKMRIKNNAQQESEEAMRRRYQEIEDKTVGTGSTYSANDAWDDYIRGETDYTTVDGSHIKLSNSYDHVYEGDYGNIYAGSSADGPAGSTELSQPQIGN